MAKPNPTDLQKALKDANYPADRDSLVERAKDNGADRQLVDQLAHLKKGRFEGPDEVQKAVFKGK
ncbi:MULTISPECIES: DUF2795 domain-containing protein [Streptomyces violaceusniger group]|uniref:DUF2795 domain-containing protein n=2 Tax=Streptomyces violaceusniger group TaxID=2839105 RepID=A0A1H4X561_STRMJ|nr:MULTISPECIES: DUF2795 domain-containing protein [Streptomyces violaceusniger group]AEM83113.1 hypothetical protein Strvi_3440 [Streptomyces violaceusniger Tu 4113]SED00675.1 Protein of unknown function [Streptomyces melanosporofaciens]